MAPWMQVQNTLAGKFLFLPVWPPEHPWVKESKLEVRRNNRTPNAVDKLPLLTGALHRAATQSPGNLARPMLTLLSDRLSDTLAC